MAFSIHDGTVFDAYLLENADGKPVKDGKLVTALHDCVNERDQHVFCTHLCYPFGGPPLCPRGHSLQYLGKVVRYKYRENPRAWGYPESYKGPY